MYELYFYIILLYYSKVDQLFFFFLNTRRCDFFFFSENQKNETVQPRTTQEWFLITVTVTDHHCRGMQKEEMKDDGRIVRSFQSNLWVAKADAGKL